MSAPLIAGIGFRRNADAAEIVALIRQALAEAGAVDRQLASIATALDRADEPALREAAAVFGLTPTGISPERLAACDSRVVSRSARIATLRGVGCVCEAAALATAGAEASLAVPRIASGSVTCALAFQDQTRQRAEG